MAVDFRDRSLTAVDGTRIAYRVFGHGPRHLVICNGYGGSFGSWNAIAPHLAPHVTALVWDYRGQHRSEVPPPEALTIDHNVADLQALRIAEGIDRFTLCGWSVGVQVALAAYRAEPNPVDGLILLNGAHERILSHVFGGRLGRFARPTMRAAERVLPRVAPRLRPAARRLLASPRLLPALDRIGAVRNQPADLPEAMQQFIDLDFAAFCRMVQLADGQTTEDWLHEIDVPTLIIASAGDALTPPPVMRRAYARIPDARYHEFPDGTHYTVLEHPEAVARLFVEHLDRL